MIHKLRYTKVQTAANTLKIIIRCDVCKEAKQFHITPNQMMQYIDGKAKKADKWYFKCSKIQK